MEGGGGKGGVGGERNVCDILTLWLVGLFPLLLLLLSMVMGRKRKLHPSPLTPTFQATLARIFFFFFCIIINSSHHAYI